MKMKSSSPRRRRVENVGILTPDVWMHFVIRYLQPSDMLRLGQVAKAFIPISLSHEYWDTQSTLDREGPGDPRIWYWLRRRVTNSLNSLKEAVGRIGHAKSVTQIELRPKLKSQPFSMAILSTNGYILTHNTGLKTLRIGGKVGIMKGLLPPPPPPEADDGPPVYQPHCSYINKKDGVIAIACTDKSVKLIDGQTVGKKTYRTVQTIKPKPQQGHTGQITCLGMDSRAVYSGSFDKTARVWSRKNGQPLFKVTHPDVVTAVTVQDGEGGMFCTHSIGAHSRGLSVVKLNDASAGRTVIDDLKVASITASAASGGAGGMRHAYLCGLTDNASILWTAMMYSLVPFDLRTGNHIGIVPTGIGACSAFHMAANSSTSGGMVYMGGSESCPALIGCDTRMMKKVFHVNNAHDKVITSLASDTFEGVPHLFSASRDGTVRIWDTSSSEMISTLFETTSRGGIHSIRWNGMHLLAVRDQSVQVVDFTRIAPNFNKLISNP